MGLSHTGIWHEFKNVNHSKRTSKTCSSILFQHIGRLQQRKAKKYEFSCACPSSNDGLKDQQRFYKCKHGPIKGRKPNFFETVWFWVHIIYYLYLQYTIKYPTLYREKKRIWERKAGIDAALPKGGSNIGKQQQKITWKVALKNALPRIRIGLKVGNSRMPCAIFSTRIPTKKTTLLVVFFIVYSPGICGAESDWWKQLPCSRQPSAPRAGTPGSTPTSDTWKSVLSNLLTFCIRLRIRWSVQVPVTYESGSGSYFFSQWLTRCQQKTNFLSKFLLITFYRYIYISLQR